MQEPETWSKELDIEPISPNRNEAILFEELEEDDTIRDNINDRIYDAVQNEKRHKELVDQIKAGDFPKLSEIHNTLRSFGKAAQTHLVHDVFSQVIQKRTNELIFQVKRQRNCRPRYLPRSYFHLCKQ